MNAGARKDIFMLKWLAAKFEHRRAGLQARMEHTMRSKLDSPARLLAAEWRKRGNANLNEGKLAEAADCYRSGIEADSTDAICYSNLGFVLVELGQWGEAEQMLTTAVELNSGDFDAYYLLGNLARDRGERLRAITCYRAALALKADFDFCRRELCVALAQSGQLLEARRVMDQGPSFGENTAEHHFFKGNLSFVSDDLEGALACFQRARQLSPKDPMILLGLCATQLRCRDIFSAFETGRSILEIEPNNAPAFGLLAVAFQFTGQHELAVENYRNALRINPLYTHIHQNMLFALTYLPGYAKEDFLLEAKKHGEALSAKAKPYDAWLITSRKLAGRPLRVGFVSGDFNFHPVCFFLENVLKYLDPSKIERIAYSNGLVEDEYTAILRPMFAEWNKVSWMPDDELAARIHADRIDILVDLSGHTGGNRLAVFAWRPAPVQATWLGYWATTGVAEIDYILVDEVSVHKDEAQFFSEKPCYLPDTRLCFAPPVTLHPIIITDSPALRTGYITFASYQNLSKMTSETLSVWSTILAQLPLARLRLQSKPLGFPEAVIDIKKRLTSASIDVHRVDFIGGSSREAYLMSYAEVDIVLDTFPYPGGTTTAEALWVGVPTITLSGNTLLSRQGESMLRCVGLCDWVAYSEQQYIQIALEKASNVLALNDTRASLRAKALASPLFDGVKFARGLTAVLEGMANDNGLLSE